MDCPLQKLKQKDLLNLSLMNQQGLADYLQLGIRTVNRRVSKNPQYCKPINVGKKKYYIKPLVDKYLLEHPTKKMIEESTRQKKIADATAYINSIIEKEIG